MNRWTWSPMQLEWFEHVVFSIAFAAWLEARNYEGELLRGVCIGLALNALVLMLARRRALHSLLCAGFLVSALLFEPRSGGSMPRMAAHVMVGFLLGMPAIAALVLWARGGRRLGEP